jgi:hypothetical protein
MKNKIWITAVFICLSTFSIAQKRNALQFTVISFKSSNLTASQVFKIIERKTKFRFCYSPSDVSPKLLLNLEYDHQSLDKILIDIALTCNFKFLISGHTVNTAVNYPPTNLLIRFKE